MIDLVHTLGLPLLICVMMVGILSGFGIHVLKREIIFIDIALAQIAAVGAIIAHLAFQAHGDSALAYICAFGFTVIAAGCYSVIRKKVTQLPLEAVIGVSYAVAAAAALFLIGISPGGHVHIQEMLAGSILWATWIDVLWCGIIFAAAALLLIVLRTPFNKISENYEEALQQGINVIKWDFLFYVILGAVITISVRIAGVVVVFVFLIIPATISANYSLSLGKRWIFALISGVAASVTGLLFANHFDFSVGPSVSLFLGLILIVSATAQWWRFK